MGMARIVTLCLLAALAAGPSSSALGQAAGLERFEGHKAAFLIFAPDPNDPRLTAQRQVRAETEAELRAKGLLWIEVIRGRGVAMDGISAPELDEGALRARLGVGAGEFVAGLVGRDGSIKLRAHEPVSGENLLAWAERDAAPAPDAGAAPDPARPDRRNHKDYFDRERRAGPPR